MLPKQAAVLVPDALPATDKSDESRIKPVHPRAAHDLAPKPAGKRGQREERARHRHGLQMSLDGRAAEIAFPREGRVVHQAATLAKHQTQQVEEARSFADAEQILDVTGIEAVEPLGEVDRILASRKQVFGKPPQRGSPVEVGQVRRRPSTPATGQAADTNGLCAQ